MAKETVVSLHLRILKNGDLLSLKISSNGLSVSERALRLIGLDFLALANTGMQAGVPIITRQYLDGPIVEAEYDLKERANVARVPL